MRRRLVAVSLVALAVLVGAVLGRASTASNTVPNGRLGQGSQAATPYAISAISYTLDVNNPSDVAQVAFTISPTTARVVKARLKNAGAWYACTNTAGSVTCATTSTAITAATANNLTIVATQ